MKFHDLIHLNSKKIRNLNIYWENLFQYNLCNWIKSCSEVSVKNDAFYIIHLQKISFAERKMPLNFFIFLRFVKKKAKRLIKFFLEILI